MNSIIKTKFMDVPRLTRKQISFRDMQLETSCVDDWKVFCSRIREQPKSVPLQASRHFLTAASNHCLTDQIFALLLASDKAFKNFRPSRIVCQLTTSMTETRSFPWNIYLGTEGLDRKNSYTYILPCSAHVSLCPSTLQEPSLARNNKLR